MAGNRIYFSLQYAEGEEMDGGCLDRVSRGKFNSVPGYPECYLVSGVVNFFLARTDAAQKVGFDPKIKRVGHSGRSRTQTVAVSPHSFSFCWP